MRSTDSKIGMEAPLLDLETNLWTDFTFPKPLEPGVYLEGKSPYNGFDSDGTRLYYFKHKAVLRQAILFIHNPSTDLDGTWHKHFIAGAPRIVWTSLHYKLLFDF